MNQTKKTNTKKLELFSDTKRIYLILFYSRKSINYNISEKTFYYRILKNIQIVISKLQNNTKIIKVIENFLIEQIK